MLGIIAHPISGDSLEFTKYDKSFGSNLPTADVSRVPRIFFDVDNSGVIQPLFELILTKMKNIQKLYEEQRRYHTYASSLLFAYDAACARAFLKGEATKEDLAAKVDVRLIDFAHAFCPEVPSRDDNFCEGIANLIRVFESVLAKEEGGDT